MGKTTIAKKFHEMHPDIKIELNDEVKNYKTNNICRYTKF